MDLQEKKRSGIENIYHEVRQAENRLYLDKEVKKLPILDNHIHTREWLLRAKSADRLANYFRKQENGVILDLGCGNGWFSHLLFSSGDFEVLGMDMNQFELEQASRVFKKDKLSFIYGDVFNPHFPESSFDFITVGAAIQYFSNLQMIIERLLLLLKKDGELHIFDSPFYNRIELDNAKNRSELYYKELGFETMADKYFHHSIENISNFNIEYMYVPAKKTSLKRFLKKNDMPFPWLKITSQ